MKIRIKEVDKDNWVIQKRYWFWPQWFNYEIDGKILEFTDKREAMDTANKLMDPVHIQRRRKK